MDRRMKQLLRQAYEPPASKKRNAFLRKLSVPRSRQRDFIRIQAGYIRKRVWILSLILVGALFYMICLMTDTGQNMALWQASALLPLLALLTMIELSRSVSCGMGELESSCRHNLAEVLLVRMGLLAFFDIAILLPLIVLISGKIDYTMGRTLAYLLVPFFCSAAGTLALLNLSQIRKSGYICVTVSFLTASVHGLLGMAKELLYQERFTVVWEMLLAAAVLCSLMEAFRLKRKAENLQWNLS